MAKKNIAEANEETKRAKFVRMAETRMDKALTAIRRMEPLANSRNYDFTSVDTQAMIDALQAHVTSLENQFQAALEGKTVQSATTFKLGGSE